MLLYLVDYLLTIAVAMTLVLHIQDGRTVSIIAGVLILIATPIFHAYREKLKQESK